MNAFERLAVLSISLGLATIGVSAGAAFAHGGDAGLIHGCVARVTGVVRIVGANQACQRWETPIHLAKPSDGAAPLGIFDANGVRVADVFSMDGGITQTLIRRDTELVLVYATRDGLLPRDRVGQYYESGDCSGQAHIRAVGDPATDLYRVSFRLFSTPPTKILISDPDGPRQLLTCGSGRGETTGQCGKCGGQVTVAPVIEYDLTDLVPPFAIR